MKKIIHTYLDKQWWSKECVSGVHKFRVWSDLHLCPHQISSSWGRLSVILNNIQPAKIFPRSIACCFPLSKYLLPLVLFVYQVGYCN